MVNISPDGDVPCVPISKRLPSLLACWGPISRCCRSLCDRMTSTARDMAEAAKRLGGFAQPCTGHQEEMSFAALQQEAIAQNACGQHTRPRQQISAACPV